MDVTSNRTPGESKDEETRNLIVHLIEASPAAITVHDFDGTFLYANQGALDLHGYTREEFFGLKLQDIDVPESAALIQARMAELKSHGVATFEVRHYRKDGTTFPLIVNAKLADWHGKAVILSNATDITRQKLAETALRESESLFRTLAESSPTMIFINQGGKVVYVNQQCVNLMGYTPEEFYAPSFSFMSLIAPEYKPMIQRMFQRHSTGEEVPPAEYSVITKSGRRIDAIYGSRLITYQGKPAILGVIVDITERKQAEEALRESESQLKDAQEMGRIGNWEFDLTTKNIRWSEQTYRLYNRDPALGPPTEEEEAAYYSAEQVKIVREYARQAMTEGKNFKYNIEAHLPGGKRAIFFVNMRPVKDASGRVVKLFGTVQDITEQKEIEQERHELLIKTLQISELKSNLITQTAHELKTPLTSILGWGDLLYNAKKRGKNLDEIFDLEDLESILRNAERLDNLINDFLDVEKVERGEFDLKKQKISMNPILESAAQAVNFLANQKEIQILQDEFPSVFLNIDPRRIEQVIINLLSNAIKYSPEKTRITITTRIIEEKTQKQFQLLITDEGYGFTAEELGNATSSFGKAYTRQDQKRSIQGTGLGLFISRRIVEQHGGTLTIHSQGVNQGTQVQIQLPLE